MTPQEAPVRCDAHGLVYDPRLHRGCTLCRREQSAVAPQPTAAGISWLRIALVSLCLGLPMVLVLRHSTAGDAAARWLFVFRGGNVELTSDDEAHDEVDPALWTEAQRSWQHWKLDPSAAARVLELDLDVYVPSDNLVDLGGVVLGRRPNDDQIVSTLRSLNSVLLRFPERFTHAAGMKHVLLLCDLQKRGSRLGGFVIPQAGVMVLDPDAFNEGLLGHELFHMVDFMVQEVFGAQRRWDMLNLQPKTSYVGMQRFSATLAQLPEPRIDGSGFITYYAQVTGAEDRAELFRVLLVDPKHAQERAGADPVIAKKIHYLYRLIDQLAPGSTTALGFNAIRE